MSRTVIVPSRLQGLIELLEGPAKALDTLHAQGLVHRDIKPDNLVRVDAGDGTEVVKLIDFGVAAFVDGRDRLTRSGVVIGTPHYICPEAARGKRVDVRSDVFGLGAVFYELLTGELPFPDPPEGAGMQEVIEHLITTRSAAVAAGERGRALEAGFPMLVETLTACLDPDPAKRPQTGAELRQAFEDNGQLSSLRADLLKQRAMDMLIESVELVDEDGNAIDRADLELPEEEDADSDDESEDAESAPAAAEVGDTDSDGQAEADAVDDTDTDGNTEAADEVGSDPTDDGEGAE